MSILLKVDRSPITRFFLGQFGCLAGMIAVSESKLLLPLFAVSLLALALATVLGLIRAAPRRNAIAAMPALSVAAISLHAWAYGGAEGFSWTLLLSSMLVGSTCLFIFLERRDLRRGTYHRIRQ